MHQVGIYLVIAGAVLTAGSGMGLPMTWHRAGLFLGMIIGLVLLIIGLLLIAFS